MTSKWFYINNNFKNLKTQYTFTKGEIKNV